MADVTATDGIHTALLAAVVRAGGGHAPQFARIYAASSSAALLPKLRSDFGFWLDTLQPGYAYRFAVEFAKAGYESVADGKL